MPMKSLEQFLVRIDSGSWSPASRMVLGFCIPEVLRLLSGGRDQVWLSLLLFMGLLVALRVGPAIVRMILPFSREAKDIWFQRRQIAKLHDSYQWQKLFWVGLGIVAFAATGRGLHAGEQVVMLLCLVGGAAGLLIWHRSGTAQTRQGA
jgi:hypothetical protein